MNRGGRDIFLRVYELDGRVRYTKQFGSDGDDIAIAQRVSPDGSVYVVGNTKGNIVGISQGQEDIFLRIFNDDGSVLVTRQFGSPQNDIVSGLVVDQEGNAYLGGRTGGSLVGTNRGLNDGFLRVYDSSGSVVITKQFGSEGDDVVTEVK